VLQCVAVCCSVLQCVAVCCGVLQCVAVCCSVLQCVAVCFIHVTLCELLCPEILVESQIQGAEDTEDDLSCWSLFAKEPLIIHQL